MYNILNKDGEYMTLGDTIKEYRTANGLNMDAFSGKSMEMSL